MPQTYGVAPGTGGLEVPMGGGVGGFLNNLFQNKMFLQFLAAAGQDISGGGKNLGGAINQNISSQNYMKLLSQMLAGDIPEGGVIKMGAEGMDIKVPKMSGGTGGQQTGGLSGNANPFASSQSGFSASDLAGVSPEMISQALQLKQNQQSLEQKRVSDVMDMLYKGAMMESEAPYRQALTEEAMMRSAGMQQDIVEGTPSYSLPEFPDIKLTRAEAIKFLTTVPPDERTVAMKEYEYAKGQGFTGSFVDFKDPVTTTDWKNYTLAGGKEKTGLSFNAWLRQQNESKAIKITTGEKVAEKAAFNKLESQSYFDTADWSKPIDKISADDQNVADIALQLRKTNPSLAFSDAYSQATLASKLMAVRGEIEARNGTIISRRQEGNTYIWRVRFPDIVDQDGKVIMKGTERDIKYVVK